MGDVKKLREDAGIKQDFMAELLGISVPNYSKKENGTIKWSLEEAKKIAEHFQKNIEEIFFENEVS